MAAQGENHAPKVGGACGKDPGRRTEWRFLVHAGLAPLRAFRLTNVPLGSTVEPENGGYPGSLGLLLATTDDRPTAESRLRQRAAIYRRSVEEKMDLKESGLVVAAGIMTATAASTYYVVDYFYQQRFTALERSYEQRIASIDRQLGAEKDIDIRKLLMPTPLNVNAPENAKFYEDDKFIANDDHSKWIITTTDPITLMKEVSHPSSPMLRETLYTESNYPSGVLRQGHATSPPRLSCVEWN